jgi:class 3 adenylate cyclase
MESHGLAGAIQVTDKTYEKLQGRYNFKLRGPIEVKGKGTTQAYLLINKIE